MKKIAICIPTYNRAALVMRQIGFLLNELGELHENVDIYVRDNASPLEQYEEICKFKSENNKFFLNRNTSNIGLVGNLIAMLNYLDKSYDYTWFVGDDDLLTTGIVSSVVRLINDNPDFIFINHSGIEGEQCVMSSALPLIPNETALNNQINLLDIFKFSGTTMMFVTACVYKTDKLKTAIHHDIFIKDRLTAPFYWSFYCAQNSLLFIDEIKIINKRGGTSWDSKADVVFGIWLPLELFRLLFMQYNKVSVLKVALRYLPTAMKRLLKKCIKTS